MHNIYSLQMISADLQTLKGIYGKETRSQRDTGVSSRFNDFVIDARILAANNENDDTCMLSRGETSRSIGGAGPLYPNNQKRGLLAY